MALSVKPCPLHEWFENFQKMDSRIAGEHPFYPANTFFSRQYYGRELSQVNFREAYVLSENGSPRAWMLCYPLSDEIIRLRGIYCIPEQRGRGLSKYFVQWACEKNKGKYRYASVFVAEETTGFYKSCGFQVNPLFLPRQFEYYNPQTRSYDLGKSALFYFMTKDLQGSDSSQT